MAYWWVAQNHSYKEEIPGNYLWSPEPDRHGNPFHWANMRRVQPGDIILSYVKKRIYAIGIAISSAYESARPDPADPNVVYGDTGLRVDVDFQYPTSKVYIPDFAEQLLPILPTTYSPLIRAGTGNQGYLFSLPARAAHLLLAAAGIEDVSERQNPIVEGVSKSTDSPTVQESLVLSRVGQGKFRRDVMRIWSGRCCVTGLAIERLLRASHIKPWRDSNNQERLDAYNGLLLSPSYDAAFDQGFISFDDAGQLLVSKEISHEQLRQLGINIRSNILGLQANHKQYLAYHRNEVFQG